MTQRKGPEQVEELDAVNGVATLIQEISSHRGFEIITVADPRDAKVSAPVAVLPQGKSLEDLSEFLDEFRTAPARRKGTAAIRDRDSFIAHVLAFKDDDSVIFALKDPRAPRVTAIYDYNVKGAIATAAPRFGEHRACYTPPLSEPWKAWAGNDLKPMSQGDFAEFLEDRIQDVLLVDGEHVKALADLLEAKVGGPSSMLKLSRGLSVSINTTVQNAVSLSTGEISVKFVETQSNQADGSAAAVVAPSLFFLNIPIFEGGATYQVPLRLRYRVKEQKLVWSYALYRADKVLDDAFAGIIDKVKAECGLPIYLGEPETKAAA